LELAAPLLVVLLALIVEVLLHLLVSEFAPVEQVAEVEPEPQALSGRASLRFPVFDPKTTEQGIVAVWLVEKAFLYSPTSQPLLLTLVQVASLPQSAFACLL
jgi:hypothetical protein